MVEEDLGSVALLLHKPGLQLGGVPGTRDTNLSACHPPSRMGRGSFYSSWHPSSKVQQHIDLTLHSGHDFR